MLKNKNLESGFTLIELVIVIIILAVLSVTAVVKYVDMSTDAKIATLEGVSGAMRSALTLVRSEAGLQGKSNGNDIIDYSGTDIPVYNGYPAVDTKSGSGSGKYEETNRQIKAWLEIDAVAVTTRATEGSNPSTTFFTDQASRLNYIYIFFSEDYDRKSVKLKCFVLYKNTESAPPVGPQVIVQTDDC